MKFRSTCFVVTWMWKLMSVTYLVRVGNDQWNAVRGTAAHLNPSLRTAHTVGPRIIEVTRNPWNALGTSKLNLPF